MTDPLFDDDPRLLEVPTKGHSPAGSLPLTDEMLRNWPSGHLFGLTQNAGMGWSPREMLGPQFLVLSTQGGLRAPDGIPIALGYHTGHFEVGLLVQAAAEEIKAAGGLPFAAYCSDPCDGRTQGTVGMFDSLAYRNDAAMVMRRQIRSLPQGQGVIGIATCDKGLPAMMMALAGSPHLPSVLVPGGVTLPPSAESAEDTARVQTIGARYAQGELSLEDASHAGCAACGSAGGGCQFLGTAATAQVIGEALGMTLPHAALAPSGEPIWLDMATRSAACLRMLAEQKLTGADLLTDASVRNAMAVHAACGGSTNLLLHLPAIAFAAGLTRPTVEDWMAVNRAVPRFVDVLPNGPTNHPTIRLFLAGGVPEVMLHLREMGKLDLSALTVTGRPLEWSLEQWEQSERRKRLRERLYTEDGVDPNDVIIPPQEAQRRKITSTVCFPRGNVCPEGSVIKATAIDPSVVDDDGVYRLTGPARVFTSEAEAIEAVKSRSIQPGEVLVLKARGPLGSGMEETYQITSALKYLEWGKHVAVVTDARFSGVSTGACIGHVGPEALAGGPIGKLEDGDLLQIIIDRNELTGSINYLGRDRESPLSEMEGAIELAGREAPDLKADEKLPDDTRIWAALQSLGGGTWGGCVYDPDAIVQAFARGRDKLS